MKLPIDESYETQRLRLTRLKYEEAEEIFYAYASKPEATKYMSWATHRTVEDTRHYLKYAINGWHDGIDYTFGIRLKGHNRLIGSCGLMHDDGKIQFGYILSPTQWGNGYATEVCRKLMAIVKQIPYIYRVSTFVDVDNTASSKVLIKSGLVEEARLDKWFKFVNQDNSPRDCLLYKLPL